VQAAINDCGLDDLHADILALLASDDARRDVSMCMYTSEEAGRLTGDKQVAWLQGIVDKHKLAVDSQFARRLVHADLRRLLAALAMAYFRYRLAADGSIDDYLQDHSTLQRRHLR
jgi:hypothetical protein